MTEWRMPWLRQAAVAMTASLLFAGTSIAAPEGDAFASLESYVEQARQDWQVPGVAVGVIREGKVVYAKGFGVREAGKAPRVDAHSLFQIGSLTKAFTATALALLVDEGKLGWDDPVIEHLPAFRVADPWLTRNITIRDLVAHRTGLEGGTHTIVPTDPARLLRDASRLTSYVPFRDSVLYSNVMFEVAGLVVAAVSGMSWDDFVAQRIFAPLRMTESSPDVLAANIWDRAHLAPTMYGEAPAGRASIDDVPLADVTMPHWLNGQGNHPLPWQILLTNGGGASGAVVSNLQDLLRWAQFNLGDGRDAGGARLLRPDTLNELHTAQNFVRRSPSAAFEVAWRTARQLIPDSEPLAYRPAYAMGWFVNSYRGLRFINHGGALLGGMSLIALIPERNMAVVVLANGYGYGGRGLLNYAIALRAFDQFLGVKAHDWSGDFLQTLQGAERDRQVMEQRLQQSRLKDAPPSLPLDAYAGEYENEAFGTVKVERAGNGLALRLPGVFAWPLQHWHNDVFRLQVTTSGVELMQFFATFQVDARGKVGSFDPGWVLMGGPFKPAARPQPRD